MGGYDGGGGGGGGGVLDKDMRELVMASSLLSLGNAIGTRENKAALGHTILMKAESDIPKVLKGANKKYESVTENKKGHGQGPPDYFRYRALVLTLAKKAKDFGDEDGERAFTEHANGLKTALDYSLCVGTCTMLKAHDEGLMKLELTLRAPFGEFYEKLIRFISMHAELGDVRFGRAPMNKHERTMRAIMERHAKSRKS